MANIYIFDANDTDKTHLSKMLESTTNQLHFSEEGLTANNAPADADVVSVFITSNINSELLGRMPNLKHIACRSTGFNNIDVSAAEAKNISVSNVPTYGEHTVAEYTIMLTLALSRKLLITEKAMDQPEFDASTMTGIDLFDKTFGIIGAGRIGQNVAKIAVGLGMKVLAYDPSPNYDKAKEIGFELTDLDTVLSKSDVLSLHTPYTPENHHLINAERLAKMKPTALLINTARGELVNSTALVDALKQGELAGAALDVVEGEKLLHLEEEILLLRKDTIPSEELQYGVALDILQKLPNTIITPHNAFNTAEAVERINQITADNITGFVKGDVQNKIKAPPKPKGKLVLVRHGESEWNAAGKWTGTRDVHLSELGFKESAKLGQAIKDIKFDFAFCSEQIRALETLECILDTTQQFDVEYERSDALDERDYGDYTGKNKWEMRDLIGEEEFNKLRRDWDYDVPNGETLKDVFARTIPFYQQTILPKLNDGQTVLVVSHGNALRSLIKFIENISDTDVADVEMLINKILVYEITDDGHLASKAERTIDIPKSLA
jgi:D-lactate dehydrogenase